MTDTQTAFVLVPRELAELIADGDRRYSDEWWNGLLNFRNLLSEEPKPPESEIGPVAWAVRGLPGGFRRYSSRFPHTNELGETVEPLYPQARIDADAAIIAGLRHDVESAGSLRLRLNAYRDRAEAAEARENELERRLRDATAIVDRIWGMLGRPSYEALAGRSIYDLIAELQARVKELEDALTPSAETKAAYMGEFTIAIERVVNIDDEPDDEAEGATDPYEHISVPWTTIKEIMTAIRALASKKGL